MLAIMLSAFLAGFPAIGTIEAGVSELLKLFWTACHEPLNLVPIIRKRKSLDLERELRALMHEIDYAGFRARGLDYEPSIAGKSQSIELRHLFQTIHSDPFAQDYFWDVVKDVTRKHGLEGIEVI